MKYTDRIRHMSSFQLISSGFLLAILTGTALLMLPISVRGAETAPFMDALFTAVSATCVTGLAVHDTALYWSPFGQAVLLILIQIGGMGVITFAVSLALLSGRKIGLMQRSTLQDSLLAPQVGGIVRLTWTVLKISAGAELLGMAVMAPVFCRDFGLLRGLWYALFHSVSAFCNAGFDLMGVRAPFSSLMDYDTSPVICLTIMALIVMGGLGFMTWNDIRTKKLNFHRYTLQSKVILSMTLFLITLGACYFYFFEFAGAPGGHVMSPEARFWNSLFMSVTPRTAGYNTYPIDAISERGLVVMIVLMLIGGAPGSTAGGIKITTVAVLAVSALSIFRRRNDVNLFGRRISEHIIKYAAAVFLMDIFLFLTGGFFISCAEDLPVLPCFFEAASAMGTVGLSTGITPGLSTASRCVLITLMFLGRVGGLTLMFAALSVPYNHVSRLPREKITVG